MNPLRRKRLLIILAILVGVGIAVGHFGDEYRHPGHIDRLACEQIGDGLHGPALRLCFRLLLVFLGGLLKHRDAVSQSMPCENRNLRLGDFF